MATFIQTDFSGLEVAPSNGPYLKPPDHSDLEVRHESTKETSEILGSCGGKTTPHHHEVQRPSHHTIGGLRNVTFWLILALVAAIIIGVVGGSVGGTLSRKSQAEEFERQNSVRYARLSISSRSMY